MGALVIPLDLTDPVAAFQPFADDDIALFLDSAAHDARGRFSYLAVMPYRVIRADGEGVTVDGARVEGSPFDVLARLQAENARHHDAPVPFAGGLAGYISYEAGRHVDRFPALAADAHAMPELVAGQFDLVIAFDHIAGTCQLISTGAPEKNPAARARRALTRAEAVLTRLTGAPAPPPIDWTAGAPFTAERSRAEAEAVIARAIDYIHAGDIFQANITHRMSAPRIAALDDFMLYRRLRALSPAPFAAYLRAGADLAIMSASPERFLSLSPEGHVETRPIKGTAPRFAEPARDLTSARTLSMSEKDRAENLMIVDLMRNDLSRVCRQGSVAVPVLNVVETFASVHHLVSVVTGRLMPRLGPVDLLRATFPGGSITGAPKIRAMEIIAELEARQRGVCFGSVFWISTNGAMDASIAIRTLYRNGETLVAEAGGGIVADSDPASEYDEAMDKMRPLVMALSGEAHHDRVA